MVVPGSQIGFKISRHRIVDDVDAFFFAPEVHRFAVRGGIEADDGHFLTHIDADLLFR